MQQCTIQHKLKANKETENLASKNFDSAGTLLHSIFFTVLAGTSVVVGSGVNITIDSYSI